MSRLIITSATRARFSRRALLRRMGYGAAMLPLLNAERVRAAAPGGGPRRLITLCWSNGVWQPNFYPQGNDPTERPVMQPLAPLKDRVTLIAGLDHRCAEGMMTKSFGGHSAYNTMYTCTYKEDPDGKNPRPTSQSVDQAVSDFFAQSVNLAMPLLQTTPFGGTTSSFRAGGVRNTPRNDPGKLFQDLLGLKTGSPTSLSALKARRQSVLDFVGGELAGFGKLMGSDDRSKIDAHLDAIRRIEKELQAAALTTCDFGKLPAGGDYQAVMKAFNDLTVMAIRCDVTRTVSSAWAQDGGSGPASMPWLNLKPIEIMCGDGNSLVHAIAHRGASAQEQKTIIDNWYMGQLAYLAGELDKIKELDSTALDNSLIVMINDMASANHGIKGVPVILVGKAGGAIKSGRVIKVGNWAGKTGTYWSDGYNPHTDVALNKLMVSLMNAMGMPVPGDTFGDPRFPGHLNTELRA